MRSSVVLTLQYEPLFQDCIDLSVLLGRSYPVDALSYKARTHEAGLSYGTVTSCSFFLLYNMRLFQDSISVRSTWTLVSS